MRKKLSLVVAIIATALCTGSAAFALENQSPRERDGLLAETEKKVESTVSTVTNDGIANATTSVSEKIASQREKIEARKAELRQKLEQKSAERKQKLEGRRLAQCQNRQTRINDLMVKSSDVSGKHLANIQKFEESIRTFAEKKAIDSEAFVAQAADVDAKEASAIVAIEFTSSQQFDCSVVDAEAPSGALKTARETKRTALHDYRESVIQLIKLVKQEFAQTQSAKEDE